MALCILLKLNISGMAHPQNANGDGLQVWKWLLGAHHEIHESVMFSNKGHFHQYWPQDANHLKLIIA
jgi:hypothetical protein